MLATYCHESCRTEQHLCKSATAAFVGNTLLAVLPALLFLSCETIHHKPCKLNHVGSASKAGLSTLPCRWESRWVGRRLTARCVPGIAPAEPRGAGGGAAGSQAEAGLQGERAAAPPAGHQVSERSGAEARGGRGGRGRRAAGPGGWKRGPRFSESGLCGLPLRSSSAAAFTCLHTCVCSAVLQKHADLTGAPSFPVEITPFTWLDTSENPVGSLAKNSSRIVLKTSSKFLQKCPSTFSDRAKH